MCGRFYVDDETAKEIEKVIRKIDRDIIKSGDIHPGETAMVMKTDAAEIKAQLLKWGYDSFNKKIIFNARAETVMEKPMFRYDYETRRCIIPASKFYEWKQVTIKQKDKYDFYNPDGILYLAGIYHKDPEGDRFTILTKEAEGCMSGIHNRMPVMLLHQDIHNWLFSKEDADKLLDSHFEKLKCELSLSNSGHEEYNQISLF